MVAKLQFAGKNTSRPLSIKLVTSLNSFIISLLIFTEDLWTGIIPILTPWYRPILVNTCELNIDRLLPSARELAWDTCITWRELFFLEIRGIVVGIMSKYPLYWPLIKFPYEICVYCLLILLTWTKKNIKKKIPETVDEVSDQTKYKRKKRNQWKTKQNKKSLFQSHSKVTYVGIQIELFPLHIKLWEFR